MSDEHRVWAWTFSPYERSQFVMHLALADLADVDGVVRVSLRELAALTRTATGSVRRAVAEFVADGFLDVIERANNQRPMTARVLIVDELPPRVEARRGRCSTTTHLY